MTRIGLLSDTHSVIHPKIFEFLSHCDEIWHAGDWGNIQVSYDLLKIAPVRGVFGNIDDFEIRNKYPEILHFEVEDVRVMMTHIGGYPGKFSEKIKKILDDSKPLLFISGHSHILKVMFDKKYNMLYMNPGAAGIQGFHRFITAIRFNIDGMNIKDLEVFELPK